ncbi:hypothetical protein D5783_02445 [Salmonella enterica subsp. enterica serovar Enteritidis]|nr:hypothetical protein [Salmonella enterica]EBR9711644.1 hypothetical protein [Salmonella enterica subsp. enterica serovar Enteritidis]EBY6707742.1 hypothetical protein [Salmonella enterica subsp. enterica serovar Enteritidis]EBZ0292747.1 hypothetical protein [Salmonella enterica subsp. enterica serovar Enteritidis]HAC6424095.1 hypothetical protein [Salmonella enterica subsp. enterica serovar Emek]
MDGGDRRLMPFCTKRCCESKIRNSQKMPDAGCRMPDSGCAFCGLLFWSIFFYLEYANCEAISNNLGIIVR